MLMFYIFAWPFCFYKYYIATIQYWLPDIYINFPRSQNDWEVFYCQAWHLLFHRRRYDTIFCFLFFSFIFLLLRLTSKCAIEFPSHGVSCYICILSYKKKYYYTLWEHLWIWNLKCNISEYFKSERFYAFFISSINLSQDS